MNDPVSYRHPTAKARLTPAARERRANLIFIGALVALMLPGISITMWKFAKNIQSKRPLTPPATRGQFAYMDTTPQFVGIPRVTPPVTGGFVAAQADRLVHLEPALRSIVASGDFKPVMSDQLHLQLIALGPTTDGYHLGLIGWNQKFIPIPELYTFTGHRADGSTVAGKMGSYEAVNMPLDVRDELKDYGYILPPDGIVWMILSFPGTAPVTQVDMTYHSDNLSLSDTLRIPSEVIDPTAPATASPGR